MRRTATIAFMASVFAVFAGHAHALTCAYAPGPVDAFKRLDAAGERLQLVFGTLRFDPADFPKAEGNSAIEGTFVISADLSGQQVLPDGRWAQYVQPIDLQVDCAIGYCGAAMDGMQGVFFIRVAEPIPRLIADVCDSYIHSRVTPAEMAMLSACLSSSACPDN